MTPPPPAADRDVPVLFIAGSGRSGSTLLERLLCTAPGWFGVGELKYAWRTGFVNDERCGCGEPFSRCPFWSAVRRRYPVDEAYALETAELVHRHESRRDVVRELVPCPGRTSSPRTEHEYGRRLAALTDAIVIESRCELLVNSSKSPAHARILIDSLRRPVHVVHLVRDSRALAHAWAKSTVDPGRRDGRLMPQYGASRVAKDWLIDNVLAESLRRDAASYRRLRYEDLIDDPGAALAQIASDVAAPSTRFAVRVREVDLGTDHIVHGNPMRFRTGQMALTPDRGWVDALPARTRRQITVSTAPLLLRYGYRLTVPQ